MHELLLTRDAPTPIDDTFRGYAFQGGDLIIGAAGHTDFSAAGHSFEDDVDGCYVHVRRMPDGRAKLSCDFRGYYPIFYYPSAGNWILSSSLERIAGAAHERGLPLSLRQHQFDAWKSNRALVLSLTSKRTVFDEIYCLSYDEEMYLGDCIEVRKKQRLLKHHSYGDALRDMMSIWAARIDTITESEMSIRADLTGGVDSRTVMAFLMFALDRNDKRGLLNSRKIYVNSQRKKSEDYKIAQCIAGAFRFPLNNPDRESHIGISSEASFQSWKAFNLGRYSPHILPISDLDNPVIILNGVGGEEHRPFYSLFGHGSFDDYLASFLPLFSQKNLFEAWRDDIVGDLATPASVHDHGVAESIRHYRRHRGRHHAAKQPANNIMGTLLSNRAAYECVRHMPPADIARNQYLFDIMLNSNTELATMEYDNISKAPTLENFDNFTKIEDIDRFSGGRVWRADRRSFSRDETVKPMNMLLKQAVLDALADPDVARLVGANLRQKTERQAQELTNNNNLHRNGHLLHLALLAETIVKYAS